MFTTINGVSRQNFAVLDRVTGQPTPFIADADNTVKSITIDDNNVYVAGFFNNIQGNSRDFLAGFNRVTGTITSLAPTISGVIYDIEASGDTLYLGGGMSNINGQPLSGLAALNSTTGVLYPWLPNPAGVIKDIELYNNSLYVGGEFTSISGFSYSNLAAFDHNSLSIISWSPNPNEEVNTIDARKTNVYIGGEFTAVNGVERNRLAAFDLPAFSLSDWNPDANNIVYDVKINGGYVYATGTFDTISGQKRNRIATINGVNTQLSNWNPNLDITGFTIDATLNNLYLGGGFTKVNGKNRNKLAAFSVDEPPVIDSVFQQFGCQDKIKSLNVIVSDERPSSTSLTVTSSNQTLVSNGNISVSGTNGDLTIDFNPALGEIGSTTIKLIVADEYNKKDSMEFDLTFVAPYFFHDTTFICAGDSALIFGNYETVAGDYFDSLVNVAGCDSINKKTLIINALPPAPTITTSSSPEFCNGDSVVLSVAALSDVSYCWVNQQGANQYMVANDTNGVSCLDNSTSLTLHTSDTISMVITDTNACSVLSTNSIAVIVHSTPQLTIDSTFDLSCHENIDGRAYITVTDTNSNLTFDWSNDGTGDTDDTEDIFNLDSNKYYIVVENNRGCSATDSVLIGQPNEILSNQTITLCAGDSLTIGTKTYKSTGVFTDTISATNGCDSIVTSNLTVLDLKTDTVNETICFEDSIVVNGTTYNWNNPTGIEIFTNVGPLNCDSTVVINLSVLGRKTDTINETICFEDSIVVNGTTYNWNNPTGIEVFTNIGPFNCDSTVIINLDVLPRKTDTINETICFEDSVVVNGITYNWNNPTGVEVFTNIGSFNCDSTVVINLNVLTRKTDTINQTICSGDTIEVNGTAYHASNLNGTEVFNNVGTYSCDSTVVISLTLDNNLTTTINFANDTLKLQESYDSYQWIDCDNGGTAINGDTNEYLAITTSGNYAVIVTQNNCVDTSACFAASISGIEQLVSNTFELYPNPVRDQLTISFIEQLESKHTVTILNSVGKTVKKLYSNNQQITIDVSDLTNAIYFIRVDTINGSRAAKFIKR